VIEGVFLENSQKSIFNKKSDKSSSTPNQPQWRVNDWYPDLPAEVKTKLRQIFDELLKFNPTVNLVSAKSLNNADQMHFADSILASQAIYKSAAIDEIYDFGSGNGFPGLVFALLYPSIKVNLVELDQRKSEYLKHCINVCGIKNCVVINKGVEALAANSVKFAMSRGFANITKAIMLARKVMPKGGKYYHLKSEEWPSEVASIPIQLCSFWSPSLVSEYKLPNGEIKFAVVKTEKTAD